MAHADARAPVARDAAIDDAIDTFIFDLDGTLYPITNGYEHACRARVFSFMVNRIGGFASESHAKDVWWSAFQRYNQTLRSLRALGYDAFDAEEYWAYTRGDAREFLKPNAEALAFVEALRGKKYVFTNCHETQARQALEALGLLDCFDGVFGAGRMDECCKPEPAAFEKLFAHFSIAHPHKCVFFEDSLKNLRTAKLAFGMRTVLVASPTLDEELATETAMHDDASETAPTALACVDCVVRDVHLCARAVRAAPCADAALLAVLLPK